MAAPVVPESDSIRRAVSLLNAVDPGRFPRLLSRLLQKLHLKAVYHNLKPASLQQQLQSIHLDQDKAEAFASAWASAGQDTIEKFRQRVLTPQKLETIGWQLNLQMAESMQAKLKSPRAVLELGVSNEDSKQFRQKVQEKEVKSGQGKRKGTPCANHCIHGKHFCGLGRSQQVSKNKT
ncbi:COMM domain-containing protein 10 isoform X10 [Calonectris borealis]|uniref:COMM domain-containing protein 10 isoform X10 n=1 Tax=Calonectris borealis TaxID=1323832 RepID=UPI003F4B4DD4